MTKPTRPDISLAPADPWQVLSRLTAARIGLGRAGGSVPTRPMLEFQLAHAQARDAVQHNLDVATMATALTPSGCDALQLHSAATDRATFIARPDLGRILNEHSRTLLGHRSPPDATYDCAFVIADGLSARAIEHHATALLLPLLDRLRRNEWHLAPITIVQQGRVAIADEIGALLNARMTVILIGERPGLSSPDSLGIYLTYDPLPGRTNAERNCISNVREPNGLSYAAAAHKLFHLMTISRQHRISGVGLKEDAPEMPDDKTLSSIRLDTRTPAPTNTKVLCGN